MSNWDAFQEEWDQSGDHLLPKVSIIIPTLNSAPLIASTLETLLEQDYPDYEIIVIDAASKDRTMEVVKSLRDNRVKVYSVSSYSRYEMLNKGITHAEGEYLNFLFPGDFYLHQKTLRTMIRLAQENENPSMVYCGTVLRAREKPARILYRKLTLNLLRSGRQPTSLQSCWFKSDVFKRLGMFDTGLQQRGGLDLMCRIMLNGTLKSASTNRVFTDYDLRAVTQDMVVRHFWETMQIVNRYFGFGATLVWLCRQKDIGRYLKLWRKSLKAAFTGK
ncbi:MAG: glycosyltransferase [Chlamydiia bacterium]|nr:glycosyltransferase [Chlamydiia bacterium]